MDATDIGKGKWINYGRWTQPTISGAFWVHWDEAKCTKEIGRNVPLPPIVFLDGYHLTPATADQSVKEFFIQLYKKGKLGGFCNKFESVSKSSEVRILSILNKKTGSNLGYANELFAGFLEIIGAWAFLFRFSSSIEEIAKEQGLIATDEEIVEKIKPYTRVTWLEEQTLEIKALARMLRKSYKEVPAGKLTAKLNTDKKSKLYREVEEHVSKFLWFGTHHWEGEGYTIEKCLSDIQDVINKGLDAENVHIDKKPQSKDSNPIWKLLATFAYWRTHCAELAAKVVFASRTRLESIAHGWGMNYNDLIWLSSTEISEALKKSTTNIKFPENYSERRKGYGIYINDGKEFIVTGKELSLLIDKTVPKVDTSVSEIKGTVASKQASVTGKVRVIMGPSDFHNFLDGDILVANETTPDFVPLMKKAAAIVTDTGGITSHAAIVSRELKKPCVIGTKIATKVFKNGDVISVDIQNGVVKIIKRAD